ncbi:MAG: OmpA family protein [Bacteroidetes bacterium]|nr:MAG: OmpA family protein [Bacteroidota bacterium]
MMMRSLLRFLVSVPLVLQGVLSAQELSYRSDFVQPDRRWELISGTGADIRKEAGTTRLIQKEEGETALFVREQYIPAAKNYQIDLSIVPETGAPLHQMGLCWSVNASGSRYYAFVIRPEGYFSVVQVQEGVETMLLPWQEWKKKAKTGEPISLSLRKQGWMLYFSINEKEIASLSFPRQMGARQGVVVKGRASLRLSGYQLSAPAFSILTVEGPMLKARRALLDSAINSPLHETAPLLGENGRNLFFTRGKTLFSDGGIWHAKVQGDSMWTRATWWDPRLPVYRLEPVSCGPSGEWLRFLAQPPTPGYLYYARANPEPGEQARREDLLRLPGDASPASVCLSSDGQTLILAADLPGGYGDLDLYVSFRNEKGQWSSPLNLGPSVNSFGREFSPWTDANGDTLYYASDGKGGYGCSDIFVSARLSSAWTQWSEPLNLGPRINSPGWEGWFRPLPGRNNHFYLSSTDSLRGDFNIYGVRVPIDPTRQPLVRVEGRLLNQKTGEVIAGQVQIREIGPQAKSGAPRVEEAPDGHFSCYLPLGIAYELCPVAPGYFPRTDTLDVRAAKLYREVQRDLYLSPLETGQSVRLDRVYFERARAVLLAESYGELDRLLTLLQTIPTLEIEIRGHTDNVGNEMELQALSEDRAEVVKQYLLDGGIAERRLRSAGFGSSVPIADNARAESRALNRRVEFVIIRQ